MHLSGHGGDEVLSLAPTYLHDLIRRHPVRAWRHLRGFRALRRWPLRACLRGLAEHWSYPVWLAQAATRLDDPPRVMPLFG